jgi:signal-transduction protein with cAMP-binding, CBS, and nucleotidyltransferase domain
VSGNIMVIIRCGASRWPVFKTVFWNGFMAPMRTGPSNLAIFMDARAVAGDASLLRQARFAHRIMAGNDAFCPFYRCY